MSAIDDQISDFFDHMTSVRWQIEDNEKWMASYEKARRGYPAWVTRDGRSIKVADIEDGHLENLIPFVERQAPESGWVEVFKAERMYRKLRERTKALAVEYSQMVVVADKCL